MAMLYAHHATSSARRHSPATPLARWLLATSPAARCMRWADSASHNLRPADKLYVTITGNADYTSSTRVDSRVGGASPAWPDLRAA